MFNICKCNLFHFLYANAVSLLLAKKKKEKKTTGVSGNRESALAAAVNNKAITEGGRKHQESR